MATSLLRTKLHIPHPRAELVPRPHLVRRLQAGMSARCSLVCAPAGFGKTTLVSNWLHVMGEDAPSLVGWLSLDARDDNPRRFLTYLVASLQASAPEVGGAAQALLAPALASAQEQQGDDMVERVLSALINEVCTLTQRVILVLDDYQEIHSSSIHRAIIFLVEHLPDTAHLVVTTRADPPFPLARWRGRGDLNEIRQEDLRFTVQESQELIQAMGLDLVPKAVRALNARTEGWAAGLQMAAISMRGAADTNRFVQDLTGSHRFILDYLTQEVLDQQLPSVQEWLLQTSILDRLCGSLCEAVCASLAPGEGQAMLEQLESSNLFVTPLDDERHWYRYHRLFADLLRQRLQRTYADQIPVLHSRASAWYEQEGLVSEAIDHALAADDTERAASLIEGSAEAFMLRSEIGTLLDWIQKLTEDQVRARPLLSIYYALVLLYSGYPVQESETWVQHAKQADGEGTFAGEVLAFRALLASFRQETAQSAALSAQALELLPADRLFFRSFVTAFLGIVYLHAGDIAAATPIFQEAARLGEQSGNLTLAVIARCHLGELAQIQGRLGAAQALYEQALADATDERGHRHPIAGIALTGLGQILRERNQLQQAEQSLQGGIDLVLQWGRTGAIGSYIALARVQQALGHPQEALDLMREAEQIAAEFDAMQIDDVYVAANKAQLLLAQGNIQALEAWAEDWGFEPAKQSAASLSQQPDAGSFMHATEYLLLSRLHLVQNRPQEALQLLEALRRTSERAGWHALTLKLDVLQAMAYQMMRDDDRAQQAIERALQISGTEGHVRLFIDEGPALVPLLRKAAQRGIAAEHVKLLLEALQLPAGKAQKPPSPASSPDQGLIEPLSEREVQVLRLLKTHLSSVEIADQLYLSVHTVRSHIKNIYQKIDVHGRAEAVERAQKLGLI